MGGMGMIVTALASAQQKTGRMKPAIVMPLYSFLREKHSLKKEVNLTIHVHDKKGRLRPVDFQVWKMIHPTAHSDNVADDHNTAVASVQLSEPIPVYLIGPAQAEPFDKAFFATEIVEIYSSPDGLPQEWSNQYFNKASAEFLIHQAVATNPSRVSDSTMSPASYGVDVIHLHGATNAYAAKYIRDAQNRDKLGATPPSILYTMHDYLDELQYTIMEKNVQKFLDRQDGQLQRYIRGGRMFMSSLGIDYANVVTFVSHRMAVDVVEGRDDFYLKELVMNSILRKAEKGRFFGITNGVDYGALDPFSSPTLAHHKAAFPEYALNLDRARRYLVDQGVLSPEDMNRPLVLFVGRFQYNKGLEMFHEAAQHFMKRDMKFLIIGQPNNYPFEWIKKLEKHYSDHVLVMSTAAEQEQWLLLGRAAADFVFVPSLTESFGLVAAEGLLFGSPVISTGAGGLKEFLRDRPKEATRRTWNGYLFEPFDSTALEAAIEDAYQDYTLLHDSRPLREDLSLRMIRDAFNLGWDRPGQKGPVHDYLKAYQVAMMDNLLWTAHTLK
ncbi:hypothetical protein BX666DRAFT_1851112 [Dichotomocladium elegans]|nr:hypothetical protein BX666DRAFT_1851112 [Dichotomocladium elegans]